VLVADLVIVVVIGVLLQNTKALGLGSGTMYLLRFVQRPTRPNPGNEILWERRYEITRLL